MNEQSARVALVTGAGGGLGRAEAMMLAETGVAVVVNDVGTATGALSGETVSLAQRTVDEIVALGHRAVANRDDIGSFDGARSLVRQAIDTFGRLDVVVNNAGIVRDKMFVSLEEKDWDDVIRVHLKGTFAVARHAAEYWRAQSKAGVNVDARIINTTSGVGLFGNVGQANYAAAKAGIAGLTRVQSMELQRYGVSSSAIAPMALTPMTENLRERSKEEKQAMDPRNVAALVTWLAGDSGRGANGLVFNIKGGYLSVADGWRAGAMVDRESAYSLDELDTVMPQLISEAQGPADILGRLVSEQPA